MRAFYKVTPGPTFDICKKHVDQWSAANKAAVEWRKSSGLPVESVSGTRVWFEGTFVPPKTVWKKGKKGCFTPREKSPEGVAIIEQLRALPQYPSSMELLMAFIGKRDDKDIMRINQSGWPGMVKNKSEDFYRLHIDPYWLPDDRTGLTEIVASEYYDGSDE